MFFSKKKPDALQILAAQSHTRRATPAQKRYGSQQKKPSDCPDIDPEITDINALPQGEYIAFESLGIPNSFNNGFACLANGPKMLVVIVASDVWSSHSRFELIRRLQDAKIIVTAVFRTSLEIIKSIHFRNVSSIEKNGQGTTSIETFAWDLIDRAIVMNSSDIHIESRSNYAQVYYRVHGERFEQPNISKETALAICNVLYGFHADSSSKRIAWDIESVHDTSIEHTCSDGRPVQLRFSSGPIHPGGNFHAVIRILVMDTSSKPLDEVGYTPQQIAAIDEMLTGAQGMVLLVGPTNSGKSTSMQALMRRIFDHRGKTIKAITVEDPVEYLIPGACQMGVPKGRKSLEDDDGKIYSTFLKATLRQDPDVVMVGEVRDEESAGAIKNLVLAGRKLLTTLHVYEAFSVYQRLLELGVPASVLMMEGFISGIVFQRLVPVLCPECSITATEAYEQGLMREATYERLLRVADFTEHNVRSRRPSGCAHCNYTGIVGRSPCAALLVPDSVFLAHMRVGNEMAARNHWNSNSALNIDGLGVTAVAHAIYKMRQGIHDPTDIETQIGALVINHSQDFSGSGYSDSYSSVAAPFRMTDEPRRTLRP